MSQPQRIFIVGHHGAGKGVLANAVAQSLEWRFVDADFGLEAHVGRHLHEILGKQGQNDFYDCQFEILTALCDQEHLVVTTDSSVVCSEKNRQLLRNEMTVWLDVSTPIQIERTLHHPTHLLPIPSLNDFFDRLHEERDGLYKEVARLTIQGDDGKLEDHTNYLVKTLFRNK
ncbi:shikimate kinase [Legionella steigerwaltii]|uniref:Shikimate kinase n=1 Tax=Legionella steigerwaltii TaxID=460 RepID=A0A378LFL2_9GAMM|nr:shikimate kinase [Legionella steigerwaltii]KTD79555.1 shikimate kinase [Legionella steigerwaltii]STY24559.1 shikimate kinase [Legionella steigerwaltii]